MYIQLHIVSPPPMLEAHSPSAISRTMSESPDHCVDTLNT